MKTGRWVFGAVLFVAWMAAEAAAVEVAPLVKTLQAVGPNGAGHREAAKAWEQLARADAAQLPEILAGLDRAGPLAANWIRTAVDAIAERQLQRGALLPVADLERFVLDTAHAPRARRLAYEWLVRADPSARERLIPGMLNDPSAELRRDAVARLIDQATALPAEKQSEAADIYQKALASANDLDQVELLAERLKKLGQTVDLARQLGYLTRWKLIAPFDNSGEKGFDAVYPPERELRLDASHPGKHGDVKWIDFASPDKYGAVDFNKAFAEEKHVVGYATAEFVSKQRREVQLQVMSDNAVKVWLNGEQVGQFKMYHGGTQPDQFVMPAVLRPGRNVILVKVCQNNGPQEWDRSWEFKLRVCDASGGAVLSADRTEGPGARN